MLVRSGITLVKYWFPITDEEQQLRIHDPMKQWKLSPMDLQSRVRWDHFTKAKEEMLERTNIPEAPGSAELHRPSAGVDPLSGYSTRSNYLVRACVQP